MQERWFDVVGDGGVRLRAREIAGPSADAPGLILHHGLASSQRIWDLMLPSLARHFRVVTYDARGHGLSAKPTSGYGFDRVREDAVAVIRTARLRRPAIVGHSWGAMAALDLAAERSRSVSGAVLIDGGVFAMRDNFVSWAEAKRALAPPTLDGMRFERFRAELGRHLPLPVTPQIEATVLSLIRVDPRGRIHPRLARTNHFRILHAIWEQDVLGLHAKLAVPTLAILAHGSGGSSEFDAAKRRGAARLREAGSPARVSWMEGIHDLPLQKPGELASRIRRFADAEAVAPARRS
jgi:pimeloyl-ACP methyl ester carboxylesterase